jgi:hypothetical protein
LVDNSKTDVCCISYDLNHYFSIWK